MGFTARDLVVIIVVCWVVSVVIIANFHLLTSKNNCPKSTDSVLISRHSDSLSKGGPAAIYDAAITESLKAELAYLRKKVKEFSPPAQVVATPSNPDTESCRFCGYLSSLRHLSSLDNGNVNSLRPVETFMVRRSKIRFVIGIPVVHRAGAAEPYIIQTLSSLLDNAKEDQLSRFLIVISINECANESIVQQIFMAIKDKFSERISDGTIDLVLPPCALYPIPKVTFQLDVSERMEKMYLDYLYLMSYSSQRCSDFYLQLADDLIAQHGWFSYVESVVSRHRPRGGHDQASGSAPIITDFAQLPFMATGFTCSILPSFITFAASIYNQPHHSQRRSLSEVVNSYVEVICAASSTATCRNTQPRSLFQHIGKISSFGPDISFVENTNFLDVVNPKAGIISNIRNVNGHSARDVYDKRTYFHGMESGKDKNIEITFEKPFGIFSVEINSGSAQFPQDKICEANLLVFDSQCAAKLKELEDKNQDGEKRSSTDLKVNSAKDALIVPFVGGNVAYTPPHQCLSTTTIKLTIEFLSTCSYWVVIDEITIMGGGDGGDGQKQVGEEKRSNYTMMQHL